MEINNTFEMASEDELGFSFCRHEKRARRVFCDPKICHFGSWIIPVMSDFECQFKLHCCPLFWFPKTVMIFASNNGEMKQDMKIKSILTGLVYRNLWCFFTREMDIFIASQMQSFCLWWEVMVSKQSKIEQFHVICCLHFTSELEPVPNSEQHAFYIIC